jgi:hypothetical protein
MSEMKNSLVNSTSHVSAQESDGLAELAQSEFELASRFVAAPESNQRVGWLGRADLGV